MRTAAPPADHELRSSRAAAALLRRTRGHTPAAACSTSTAAPPADTVALPRWAVYAPAPPGTPSRGCVIVCGWLGGRPAVVQRYSALYAVRGFATLTVTPPLSAALLPVLADRACSSFYAGWRSLGLDSGTPLLLHAASNGGWNFLSNVFRAATQPGAVSTEDAATAASIVSAAKGVLLDCAPTMSLTADVAWRALASIATGKPAAAAPPSHAAARHPCAPAPLPPLQRPPHHAAALGALSLYLSSSVVATRLGELQRAWDAPLVSSSLSSNPLSLLCSSGDVLIPPAEVASALRRAGRERELNSLEILLPFPADTQTPSQSSPPAASPPGGGTCGCSASRTRPTWSCSRCTHRRTTPQSTRSSKRAARRPREEEGETRRLVTTAGASAFGVWRYRQMPLETEAGATGSRVRRVRQLECQSNWHHFFSNDANHAPLTSCAHTRAAPPPPRWGSAHHTRVRAHTPPHRLFVRPEQQHATRSRLPPHRTIRLQLVVWERARQVGRNQ